MKSPRRRVGTNESLLNNARDYYAEHEMMLPLFIKEEIDFLFAKGHKQVSVARKNAAGLEIIKVVAEYVGRTEAGDSALRSFGASVKQREMWGKRYLKLRHIDDVEKYNDQLTKFLRSLPVVFFEVQ